MLLDAEQRQDDWFRDIIFDVCICGAGPAGITLARKLAAKGWSVALFESGGLELKPEAQDLAVGESVGLEYFPLESTRLRAFGGTSGHWSGITRPFEEHDFETHPHHPLSGWPIKKSDLDPFADDAAQILDLEPWKNPVDIFNGMSSPLRPVTFRPSTPVTRFGTKYRAELVASTGRVYLNATLADLELDASLRSVSTLILRSYGREAPFTVRGRYIVLCLGGMENARFLLNANRQMSAGVGNQHDVVGRFFCEHPGFRIASGVLRSLPRGPILHYAPSREMMLEQKCLNFVLTIPRLQEGMLKYLARGAVCLTPFSRKLAHQLTGRAIECFDFFIWSMNEQALNADSRILLANSVDRFGRRRAVLDWRLSELDYHTLRTAAIAFGRRMAETDIGRVQIAEWLRDAKPKPPGIGTDAEPPIHHMCTTRMSHDPNSGVVDKDCRVHGLENLYIGGSSVFATSGHAHPTYTIVQLALRLAEHLDARLRR